LASNLESPSKGDIFTTANEILCRIAPLKITDPYLVYLAKGCAPPAVLAVWNKNWRLTRANCCCNFRV